MEQEQRSRSRVLNTSVGKEDYVKKTYQPYQCSGASLPLYETIKYESWANEAYATEVTDDVVTKNFQKLVAKGAIINNPYSNVKTSEFYPMVEVVGSVRRDRYTCSPLRWTPDAQTDYSGSFHCLRRTWNDGLLLAVPDYSADIDRETSAAVTEAWANIDSSEILALVSVLESEKTLKGLFDISRRVYKFLRNVKRLQLSKLRSQLGDLGSKEARSAWRHIKDEFSLDALANRHLEIRYGLRPLYYDMLGALKALFKDLKLTRSTFRGWKTFSSTISDTKVTDVVTNSTWAVYKTTLARSVEVKVDVRAGVLCEVDFSDLDPWGLQRYAETIWDIVPYSFIIDWFFNVGETISAWTPDAGFSPRASWVKVVTTTTQTSNIVSCDWDYAKFATLGASYRVYPGGISNTFNGPCAKIVEITSRTPSPDRYTLPTWQLRLNAAKILDLAALSKHVVFGGTYPLIRH